MRTTLSATTGLSSAIVFCASGVLWAQAGPPSSPTKAAAAKSAWTIGIYTGPSPFQLSPPANVTNPVLTGADVSDINADTIAHPFKVFTGSRYYMFFTAKDARKAKSISFGISWRLGGSRFYKYLGAASALA